MLIEPTIDKLEEQVEDRNLLVLLAAKRARDIVDGKRAITPESCERPLSQATKEIAENLILCDDRRCETCKFRRTEESTKKVTALNDNENDEIRVVVTHKCSNKDSLRYNMKVVLDNRCEGWKSRDKDKREK